MKHIPLFVMLICLSGGWNACGQPRQNAGISTVGLYAFHPAEEQHYRFWKACGYNTLQFIDIAVSLPRAEHAAFYARIAKGIADAQRAGFKVGVIIQSNISPHPQQWWDTFNPNNKDSMAMRLRDIATGVKMLSKADFFSFFGGDPGGAPVPMGRGGVEKWMEMSGKVQAIVQQEAPHAYYNANIWAVTHWDDKTINPFYVDFWDKEVTYGKMIAAKEDFITKDCGIEFPLHNYYRSLAFKAYADAKRDPEPYPVAADVEKLKARGVKHVWGWAHFLIDEVDDGYTGYSGQKHPTQAETRYLHRIVADARNAGLNGIFSFTDGPGSEIEAMNVYAFGRFCQDPSRTPEQSVSEFAGYIADSGSRHSLEQVIRFIENRSTWEASIPGKYQVKKFDCSLTDAGQALQALKTVRANPQPGFPLPEAPGKYIERLRSRLEDIKVKETASISQN